VSEVRVLPGAWAWLSTITCKIATYHVPSERTLMVTGHHRAPHGVSMLPRMLPRTAGASRGTFSVAACPIKRCERRSSKASHRILGSIPHMLTSWDHSRPMAIAVDGLSVRTRCGRWLRRSCRVRVSARCILGRGCSGAIKLFGARRRSLGGELVHGTLEGEMTGQPADSPDGVACNAHASGTTAVGNRDSSRSVGSRRSAELVTPNRGGSIGRWTSSALRLWLERAGTLARCLVCKSAASGL
jgi:hypothetical protein